MTKEPKTWMEVAQEFLKSHFPKNPIDSQFCSHDLKLKIEEMCKEIVALRSELYSTRQTLLDMTQEMADRNFWEEK